VKAAEVYASVTESIVSQLESGDALGNWSAPWHGRHGFPRNAATGASYRGGNVVTLWAAQIKRGYGSEHWGTYRQWAGLGRVVQRRQKATFGLKWIDKRSADDRREAGETSLSDLTRRAFPVGFALFNADQTERAESFDGAAWEPPTRGVGPDPIPRCAAFFDAIGARTMTGAPAYSPSRDTIFLPAIEAFHDSESFYATSAHEHCHWSGHASRLARDLSGRFGSDSYAAEELVAELGAAFVAASLEIETRPRADHAQYLGSWLRVLRADSRALYSAATAAQAAADYLVEQAGRVSTCAA
jgi:antirestriction protein ArdC